MIWVTCFSPGATHTFLLKDLVHRFEFICRRDLKSGHVQILNDQIEVGFQMIWILNLEAQPFEI